LPGFARPSRQSMDANEAPVVPDVRLVPIPEAGKA
jgi:hypothetical protein